MMSVEQLVMNAVAAGEDCIAMTDINNSTGIPEFAGECIKNGIRPLAGEANRTPSTRMPCIPCVVTISA